MAHQSLLRNISGWLIRHKARIALFGVPFAIFESVNFVFDHFFFPAALLTLGALWGGVVAAATAFAFNAFVFWLYDVMKVDWLQAHAVRQLADKGNKTGLEKMMTFMHAPRRSLKEKIVGIAMFMALTFPLDPVIVAIHYRESHFTGISARDWRLLAASTASACFVWLIVWEFGILLAKIVYHEGHLLILQVMP